MSLGAQNQDDRYRQVRWIEGEVGGETLRLETRPGYPSWWAIDPAVWLLASYAEISPTDRVMVSPCGHGALAIWAAERSQASVAASDVNIVAVEMATRNLAAHGHAEIVPALGVLAARPGSWDVVLMPLPKGRDLGRLYLAQAFEALRPGGRLYLAGANSGGVKSAIKDAALLFGSAAMLGYKAGQRVAVCLKPSSGETELPAVYDVPGVRPGSYHTLQLAVGGQRYTLQTRPGVFSWQGLDAGTALLLEALEARPEERFLDLGCGYGIIGIHLARQARRGSGVLLDNDFLACDCAQRNLAANAITNAEVVLGDGIAALPDQRFTLIATNPPFHSGREQSLETARAFVLESYAALAPRGRLYLVANRFLPYERHLQETFPSVRTVAQTPGYQVFCADRRR
ncbi:MAG: class I SAM-dependent methyltransferase [Anaerolineae bacterium]|nr:class I SAM-dependent methyltransferase [Anaerolineae bacterium]